MNSRAYQLSSEPNDTNHDDEINLSHVLVRRLTAEQLLDCQSQVTGVPLRFTGYPAGVRAAQLPGVRPEAKGKRRASQMDQFLEIFGKPPRLLTSETERSCECNMGQAFQMISGPAINDLLAENSNRVGELIASDRSNLAIIEELYWTALVSAPRPEELNRLAAYLDQAKDRRAELEDILWALLNSKDFVFRNRLLQLVLRAALGVQQPAGRGGWLSRLFRFARTRGDDRLGFGFRSRSKARQRDGGGSFGPKQIRHGLNHGAGLRRADLVAPRQ